MTSIIVCYQKALVYLDEALDNPFQCPDSLHNRQWRIPNHCG